MPDYSVDATLLAEQPDASTLALLADAARALTVSDATARTALAAIQAAIEGTLTVNTVDVSSLATQTTLAAVLAALADPATETTLAAIQAAVEGTLTVNTVDVSALATQTTLAAIAADVTQETGTWSYAAGTSGTEVISGRVLGITATGATSAASFTIDGGDTVDVPANMSIEITPRGNLSSPTLVFTGTASYFVEVVA